jgi:hypothetical protein
MRFAFLVALASTLALTIACNSDDVEVTPSAPPTNTASAVLHNTTTGPEEIVFCPRIGGIIGGTPDFVTPTPQPSCDPSLSDSTEIAQGVFVRITAPPTLPANTIALTGFAEFEFTDGPAGATISMPVQQAVPSNATLHWYTHTDAGWSAIAPATIRNDGLTEGTFTLLPDNLIVLAEPPQ